MYLCFYVLEFDISSTRGKIPPSEAPKTPKTIEDYEEQEAKAMENLGMVGSGLGGLKTPEYTMNYQQSVSAEDVYLQVWKMTLYQCPILSERR